MVGTVMLLFSHLAMTLCATPDIWWTLSRAACVSKKLGPMAKIFSIIVLSVLIPVTVPILALYGGMAGFVWGIIGGFQVCGGDGGSMCGSCGKVRELLSEMNKVFHQFTIDAQKKCGEALELARTQELKPGEKPVELNPIKAATSLSTALICGFIVGVVYFLTGLRFYATIVYATSRDLAAGTTRPLAIIIYSLTPIGVLLVLCMYPFIGFLVCFFAVWLTCYLEVELEKVREALSPPKPEKPKPEPAKKGWFSGWFSSPAPEPIEEPLLPPPPPKAEPGRFGSAMHLLGLSGVPFAVRAAETCAEKFWQGNAYAAQVGVVPIITSVIAAISTCFSALMCCAGCCSCASGCCCCCNLSKARELHPDEENQQDSEQGFAAPEQLDMGAGGRAAEASAQEGLVSSEGGEDAAAPERPEASAEREGGDPAAEAGAEEG
uniref:H(+)-exporting diphosphatase n=1 Tax=Alexandrium monilatum TaxID=311494 RepID=A0A7S4SZD1_9DINO